MNHEAHARYVVPRANADGSQATPRKPRLPRTGKPAQVWSPEQAMMALAGTLSPVETVYQEPTDVFERQEVDVFNPQTNEERVDADRTRGTERAAVQEPPKQAYSEPATQPPPYTQPQPQRSAADEFLKNSQRMTIEVNDGTFLLPIISAKQSQFGIILFLPMAADSTLFLPKPGTEMVVTCRIDGQQRSQRVYYPGTYAEVPELSAIVMSLIVADGDGEA
jgi:hypothetical protein